MLEADDVCKTVRDAECAQLMLPLTEPQFCCSVALGSSTVFLSSFWALSILLVIFSSYSPPHLFHFDLMPVKFMLGTAKLCLNSVYNIFCLFLPRKYWRGRLIWFLDCRLLRLLILFLQISSFVSPKKLWFASAFSNSHWDLLLRWILCSWWGIWWRGSRATAV